jgi:hypothetical protein
MATFRDDAARWFTLAAEARKLVAGLTEPEAKRKMLEVVDTCMTIAREAKARAAAIEPNDQSG